VRLRARFAWLAALALLVVLVGCPSHAPSVAHLLGMRSPLGGPVHSSVQSPTGSTLGVPLALSVNFNTQTPGTAATLPSWLAGSRASVTYVQTSASTMGSSTVASGSLAIGQPGGAGTTGLKVEAATTNLVPRTLGGSTFVSTTSGQWDNPVELGGGTATLNASTSPDGTSHAWAIAVAANASTGYGWYTYPWSWLNGSGYPGTFSVFLKENAASTFLWTYETSTHTTWTLTSSWTRYQQSFTTDSNYATDHWVLPDGRTMTAASAYGDFPQIEASPYAHTYADYGTPRAGERLYTAAASTAVFGGRLRITMAFTPIWGTSQLGQANDPVGANRRFVTLDVTDFCEVDGGHLQIRCEVGGTPVVFPTIVAWNAFDQVVIHLEAGAGVPSGWYTDNGGAPISLGAVTTVQPWMRTEDAALDWACDDTSGTPVSQLDAYIQSIKVYGSSAARPPGTTYYASTSGSGSTCSKASPCSLAGAQTAAEAAGSGTTVLIRAGSTPPTGAEPNATYRLASTWALSAADSGVTYQGYPREAPIISGHTLESLTWTNTSGSIWTASLASIGTDLYVNGNRAHLAATAVAPLSNSWAVTSTGFTEDVATISGFACPTCVSVRWLTSWRMGVVPLTTVASTTLTANVTALANMQSWTSNALTHAAIVGYEGAAEQLAAAGDYAYNPGTTTLYYWARSTDTMSTAVVETSSLTAVVTIGGSIGAPVTGAALRKLIIEGSTWGGVTGPVAVGYAGVAFGVTGYIGNYFASNTSAWYWMPAAVQVSAASGVSLSGVTVRRMGAAGISFLNGAQGCTVEGSSVYDIAGTGIYLGDVTYAASAPSDSRTIVSGNTIRHSFVTAAGVRYLDSDCIGEGYAYATVIDHNTVGAALSGLTAYGCGYSGIHSGIGWGAQNCASGVCGQTTITGNVVSNACQGPTNGGCDGGSYYFNGYRQGTTTVSGNYTAGPNGIGWYHDNGTNGIASVNDVFNNGGGYYCRFNTSPVTVTGNSWAGYADAAALTEGAGGTNTASATLAGPPFTGTALAIIVAAGMRVAGGPANDNGTVLCMLAALGLAVAARRRSAHKAS
jgi:hypothetical protein